MAFYRGVNQALNTLKNNSRPRIILSKSRIQDSPPNITQIRGFIASNSPRFSGFSPNPSISRRIPDSSSKFLQIRGFIASNSARFSRNPSIPQRLSISPSSNLFMNIPRRYSHQKAVPYLIDKMALLLVVLFFGVLSVPHIMFLSKIIAIEVKREIGNYWFEKEKAKLKHKILPKTHPDSVKVKLISKKLIAALQRGLKNDDKRVSIDFGDLEKEKLAQDINHGYVSLGNLKKFVPALETALKNGDDSVDLGKVKGLGWEILVVDEPSKKEVYCNPGGKIVVYTGLLKRLKSDEEIAAVIGHQIGHAVAYNHEKMVFWGLAIYSLKTLIVWRMGKHSAYKKYERLVKLAVDIPLWLGCSQKIEKEADYVGMLLMASAGYDPRVAPRVWKKLGKKEFGGNSALKDWFTTRPSGKKRARLLKEDEKRDKALMFYKKASSV